MATSFSPVAALQELITVTNIDKNKLNSTTQVRQAYTRTKALLPDFELFELQHESLRTENEKLELQYESLKVENEKLNCELNNTSKKLQDLTKLQAVSKTLTEKVNQKSKEVLRFQEEIRALKIKDDVLEAKWAETQKKTDEQLKQIVRLLTAQPTEKTQRSQEKDQVNKKIVPQKET